jgi:hypothetical protein
MSTSFLPKHEDSLFIPICSCYCLLLTMPHVSNTFPFPEFLSILAAMLLDLFSFTLELSPWILMMSHSYDLAHLQAMILYLTFHFIYCNCRKSCSLPRSATLKPISWIVANPQSRWKKTLRFVLCTKQLKCTN